MGVIGKAAAALAAVLIMMGAAQAQDRAASLPALDWQKCPGLVRAAGPDCAPVTLPDIWGPSISFDHRAGFGTATYIARIPAQTAERPLALRPGRLRSVARVYLQVGDGPMMLLAGNGDPATQVDPPGRLRRDITLPAADRPMTLILQLSNRLHKQGGVLAAPVLVPADRSGAREGLWTGLTYALFILLVLVAAGSFGIASRRPPRRHLYLLFGTLTLVCGIRVALVSEIAWTALPALPLSVGWTVEYLTFFILPALSLLFLAGLFPRDFPRWAGWLAGLSAFGFTLAGLALALNGPGQVTLLREPMQVTASATMALAVWFLAQAARAGRPEARLALIGGLALFGLMTLESVLVLQALPPGFELTPLAALLVGALYLRTLSERLRRLQRRRTDLVRHLRRRAEDLRLARREAEEAAAAKSQFLNAMSHELRTPLNAILGFTDLMRRESLGPVGHSQYRSYLEDIHQGGQHLLAVVNSVLDMARAEAGRLVVRGAEPVEPGPVVDHVLRMMMPQADRADVALKRAALPGLPWLDADRQMVVQILLNLVSNAVAFSDAGGQVTVRVTERDDGGLDWVVEDQGVGIPAEEQARVLEPFYQVDGGLSRRVGGTGLGLPLAKAMVEAHDGILILHSREGLGTQVTARFPAERSRPAAPLNRRALA